MNKQILCFMLLLAFFICGYAVQADEILPPDILTLSSVDDFLTFAENCRIDSYSRDLTVNLDCDIDLTDVDFNGIPIFCGEFNGNGHRITGLNIQATGSVLGLFRYITATASLSNLHISGTIIPSGSAATVGGIAGSNAGTILNCTFTGIVEGNDQIGGIAGTNTTTGTIEGCYSSGAVSGNHFVGGIAGNNSGIILKCINDATVNTELKQNQINLSDITIDNLTGSESASTVTDIGGIAGTSSGHIRFCRNTADIGYNHIGYNVGGITGRQAGYMADCENTGTISGRKEVGGIAGQLEPSIIVTYSTDTLQILEGQLGTLSTLAMNISANLNTATSGIRNQIVIIQGQIESAKNAFSELIPDPDSEDTELNEQAIHNAVTELTNTLSSVSGSIGKIMEYTDNASWALNRDLQTMSNTISSMQQTIGNASENLGGSIYDASDEDTDEDLTAKIERCVNVGAINGDMNCGGITGAICMENDLDPEDDIMLIGNMSLNFAGSYRAVITNCNNQATVSTKKQYAGGIVGLATMGLIRSCDNTGSLRCEATDYVGGIAGYSDGYIRNCNAKAEIYGARYVGGISGVAQTVSDCRAMTLIQGQENIGSILGFTENFTAVAGNYYMPIASDIGAIDQISYETMASPLATEEFLALDELPSFFDEFIVTFVYVDGTETAVTLKTGQQLTEDSIPALTPTPGYKNYWSGITDSLYFNTVISEVLEPHRLVIESDTVRDNGLPVFLAVGSLADTAAITAAESDAAPDNAIESWTVTLPANTTAIRFLPPVQCDATKLSVMISTADDQWQLSDHSVEGSYLVVPVHHEQFRICIVPAEKDYTVLYAAAGALFLVTVAIICISAHAKKKKSVKTISDEI